MRLLDKLGRSYCFALLALAIGTALAIAHRLDGNYVALIVALQGLVAARAVADDYCSVKAQQIPPKP